MALPACDLCRGGSRNGAYARRQSREDRSAKVETLLTRIGLGEYLAQIFRRHHR